MHALHRQISDKDQLSLQYSVYNKYTLAKCVVLKRYSSAIGTHKYNTGAELAYQEK